MLWRSKLRKAWRRNRPRRRRAAGTHAVCAPHPRSRDCCQRLLAPTVIPIRCGESRTTVGPVPLARTRLPVRPLMRFRRHHSRNVSTCESSRSESGCWSRASRSSLRREGASHRATIRLQDLSINAPMYKKRPAPRIARRTTFIRFRLVEERARWPSYSRRGRRELACPT